MIVKTNRIEPELIKNLFQRYCVKPAQISQRLFECDDIYSDNFLNNQIYKINEIQNNGSNILERANFFSEKSFDVFHKFYDLSSDFKRPDHIIHVTCTGYISPSAAQKIIAEDRWNHLTEITHAYQHALYK
jgi:hypothetical protein